MSKVKYYYDPDTLSYRKIEPKPWAKRRRWTVFIIFILSILFFGWKLMYHNLFPYAIILEDVPFSKHKLQLASDHIDNLTIIFDSVQEHIDKLQHGAQGIRHNIEDSALKHDRINSKINALETTVVGLEMEVKEKNLEITRLEERFERVMAGGKDQIEAYSYFSYHIQRQWKVIIVIFTVVLGTILNITIQKYFSGKREQRAFELASFKKEQYDNGFIKVEKEWEQKITEVENENKIKVSNLNKRYDKVAKDYGELLRDYEEMNRITLSILNYIKNDQGFRKKIGFENWPGNLKSLLDEMIIDLEAN
ncbi:hypothetical protein [uncultured Allomuricauda sp.]|uniref:hypothetical protein n=1 Tax=Flagellimonas sp. W118 TaxID=3410791 RepID=UPI00261B0641|nr:hypothetical protein [uncultured Allomuricauda sp.]